MDKCEFTKRVLDVEPTLYHISKSILKNDFDCADAVQEAILKAFCNLHKLREEKFFKTWICRILINECYKIAKNRKVVTPLEEIEHIPCDEIQNIGLYDAIMKLDTKRRLAVTLHYVDGFSMAQVAKILKIPQGTVKSRLSKARAELKLSLEEQDKEGENYENTRRYIRECS